MLIRILLLVVKDADAEAHQNGEWLGHANRKNPVAVKAEAELADAVAENYISQLKIHA